MFFNFGLKKSTAKEKYLGCKNQLFEPPAIAQKTLAAHWSVLKVCWAGHWFETGFPSKIFGGLSTEKNVKMFRSRIRTRIDDLKIDI